MKLHVLLLSVPGGHGGGGPVLLFSVPDGFGGDDVVGHVLLLSVPG